MYAKLLEGATIYFLSLMVGVFVYLSNQMYKLTYNLMYKLGSATVLKHSAVLAQKCG